METDELLVRLLDNVEDLRTDVATLLTQQGNILKRVDGLESRTAKIEQFQWKLSGALGLILVVWTYVAPMISEAMATQ
jgi:hypothetical protein